MPSRKEGQLGNSVQDSRRDKGGSRKRPKLKFIIGIDEVGRGCLAGPVAVAAACIPVGFRPPRNLGALKDSKQLTSKQREAWCTFFKAHPQIFCATSRAYPRVIEKVNISRAANVAALRACNKVVRHLDLREGEYRVFLDGGLFLGKTRPAWAKTVVRADEKYASVKIASIVAKVSRDGFMRRLGKRYPVYGFEIHKGYATRFHREALVKNGPCWAHRSTFLSSEVRQQNAVPGFA